MKDGIWILIEELEIMNEGIKRYIYFKYAYSNKNKK